MAPPDLKNARGGATQRYAFARGLDYLRRHSAEHKAIGAVVARHWSNTERGAPLERDAPLWVGDYGTGFGDLACELVERIGRPTPRALNITVVDQDLELAVFSAERLSRQDYCARALSPDELSASHLEFDRILIAHVLYYVLNRPELVAELASRLRPRGAMTVVVRGDACDTYAIRTAIRACAGEVDEDRRLTEASTIEMMQTAGLAVTRTPVRLSVVVPVDEISFVDLHSGRTSSDATEFVRFIGHLDSRYGEGGVGVLERELAARTHRNVISLELVTAVLTGVPCTR